MIVFFEPHIGKRVAFTIVVKSRHTAQLFNLASKKFEVEIKSSFKNNVRKKIYGQENGRKN